MMTKSFSIFSFFVFFFVIAGFIFILVSSINFNSEIKDCTNNVMQECTQDNKPKYECRVIAKDICEPEVVLAL